MLQLPSLLFSLQQTAEDWQYDTEPNPNACLGIKGNRCRWPRGKCLGGSSSINANLYVRANKKDFDLWAAAGNEGWDYESILKYLKEIEDLQAPDLINSENYGRGGYLPLNVYHSNEPIKKAIVEAAASLGYPMSSEEPNLGFFDALQTVEKGIRANAGKAFIGRVKDRENLVVALNSFVEKIVINEQKEVQGVVVLIDNKRITIKVRKEVIVSAGSLNSPQILMLSGVGPKEHLKKIGIDIVQDLPVGENLQDHAAHVGIYIALSDEAVLPKGNIIDDLYQYFMQGKGPVGEIGLTNFMGFINTRNDSIYPNIQILHVLFDKNDNYLLPTLQNVMGLKDEITSIERQVNQKSPTLKIVPILSNPKSRGRIQLRSKNPFDKPLIYANYFDNPEDIETLLGGIKFILKLLETAPVNKLNPQVIDLQIPGCETFEFKSDDFWRCAIKHVTTTLYHPVGSCKMGLLSDKGVVDNRLKVYGIKNLRVIDASIMPTVTTGNTNAPSLMIGQKGASMIVDDWSHGHSEL